MPAENDDDKIIKNKPVLITGSGGLLGNELLKQLLKEGYKVKAIYHSTPLSFSHPNLEREQCDILDVVALEQVMKGIGHVYHCAAMVSFDPKEKHQLFKVNIEGTANIVNACIEAGVTKLVHVSSVSVLNRPSGNEAITEKMNLAEVPGESAYGKSKYFGELEVWRGIGEGLKAVIVNPSVILGGNSWESSSSAIFKAAYNELRWYSEGITGFVDVRDVALAMRLLMNSKITSGRFIISAENLPYRHIFSSIAKCFGKRPPYKKVTPFLAGLVWRVEALKSLFTGEKHVLTKETARSAQAKVFYDNSKILKALPGFQFTEIEETIVNTCSLIKEKYHL